MGRNYNAMGKNPIAMCFYWTATCFCANVTPREANVTVNNLSVSCLKFNAASRNCNGTGEILVQGFVRWDVTGGLDVRPSWSISHTFHREKKVSKVPCLPSF